MNERIIYKGISQSAEGLTFQKCLELQKMILDPTFKPYMRKDNNNCDERDRLIARSASSSSINAENEKKSIVQKQLELREMILGY